MEPLGDVFPNQSLGSKDFGNLQNHLPSLKLTAKKAPENRPFDPKRKRSYSNHPFSGAKMLASGRVVEFWSFPSLKLPATVIGSSVGKPSGQKLEVTCENTTDFGLSSNTGPRN